MSGGKDSEEECAQDWGQKSYTDLIGRFKNKDGGFKSYVIATDSEFGPSWPARDHSKEERSVEKTEVSSKDKGGVFKYKVLKDVKHLDLERQSNANVFVYLRQSRINSANKLEKKASTEPQWYGSSSGPVWARLYSTVFWIYVEDDNGEPQTHKLVFPWYIYRWVELIANAQHVSAVTSSDKGSGPLRVFRVETHLSWMGARLVTS